MKDGETTELIKRCSQCACFNMRKATRNLTQYYDAALNPVGLRGTQFSLLVNIAAEEGISISLLAEKMIMDRTTLTRNLRPLEKSEYVVMGHGSDRRMRTISLTESGRNKLAEAMPLWQQAQDFVINQLGSDRTERLLSDMRVVEEISR